MPLVTTSGAVTPAPILEIADLPSPAGWPIVGNALQVEPKRAHARIERWAQEHGPVFRIQLGRRRLVVLSDHASIGQVLRDRPEGFRRNPLTEKIGAEMGLQGGVFSAEGDIWKRQRRMVMAGFDPRHIRAYFDDLVRVSLRLEQRWRRAAGGGTAIDLQADLMRFTVDAISGLAFGVDINTLESDQVVIQRHLDRIFPALRRRLFALLPTWRWIKSAGDRALDHSVQTVNASIAEFVAAARKRMADPARNASPANLLEALIAAADDEASPATDIEVAGNVMTMLLAGEDTTANTLAWMIYLLKQNPDCARKAREEIDGLGPSSDWSLERFGDLKYLEACANETMRLKPVAPMIILQSLRETVVSGVRLPAGELLWLCMRKDSVSEDYFAHADRFDPDRWLATGPHDAQSPGRVSMPFGAGPRVCPGRHLAMLEIKMALVALLANFDIDSVATANGEEPEEVFTFTMQPAGLIMKLRLRPS